MEAFWERSLESIKKQLATSSLSLALAYSLACAEKLYAGAEAIPKLAGSDIHLELRSFLDRSWSLSADPDTDSIEREYSNCLGYSDDERLIDLLDHVDKYAISMELLIATEAGYKAYRKQEPARASEAGYAVYCILDAFLIVRDDIDTNDQESVSRMERDPMIIYEFQRQFEDIQLMKTTEQGHDTVKNEIPEIRTNATKDGYRLMEAIGPQCLG